MKYILIAVIFSILIHLGIFYKFNKNVTESTSKKGNAKTSSLLYVKLQKKKSAKKEKYNYKKRKTRIFQKRTLLKRIFQKRSIKK